MTDSNDNNNPWSRRPDSGPPDILELIKKFFLGKSDQSSSNKSDHFAKFLGLGLLALIVIWALSGIFLVSPAEQAVVTRFGQYLKTVEPGPHWIPRIVESKNTINVEQVDNFSYQAEMLTQDENIVSVSLAVQYRIANPSAYLFNVVDPIVTLQQATSSALRQVVGRMTLNSVLTTGRQQLRDAVAKQLDKTLDLYKTGLSVTDVTLQPTQPPEAVTHAFDDAIKAREDEQRFINQAKAYARRVESIIKGKVARLEKSAMAYQQSVVLRAQGKTARYLALLKPYEAAPTITRERLYLDTLSGVLSNTTNIVIDSGANNLLYLPLDQILKHQKQTTAKSPLSMVPSDLSDSADIRNRPSYNVGDNS